MMFRLVLASALVSLASAAYNETFARNQVLYLTAAAYSLTPSLCLNASIPDAKVSRLGQMTFDGKPCCEG